MRKRKRKRKVKWCLSSQKIRIRWRCFTSSTVQFSPSALTPSTIPPHLCKYFFIQQNQIYFLHSLTKFDFNFCSPNFVSCKTKYNNSLNLIQIWVWYTRYFYQSRSCLSRHSISKGCLLLITPLYSFYISKPN